MEIPRISPQELKQRLESGEHVVLLDDRNPQAWGSAKEQIPGSIRIAPGELDKHLQDVPLNSAVVSYCTCPHEESSLKVARGLQEMGWSQVAVLQGGFDAWQKAGLPIEPKSTSLLPPSEPVEA